MTRTEAVAYVDSAIRAARLRKLADRAKYLRLNDDGDLDSISRALLQMVEEIAREVAGRG